mgnify:CR=1 FL=1|tara:strand:+ start:327 stop:506 length:180 start_codon:yes stop_codon:yes gene_type:complete
MSAPHLKVGQSVTVSTNDTDYKAGFVYVEYVDDFFHIVKHLKTGEKFEVTSLDIKELCV